MSADYTDEAFENNLGAAVVAQIDALVAAAPAPSPRIVEQLRLIFAPAVALLAQQHTNTELADAA